MPYGFEQLAQQPPEQALFRETRQYLNWLSESSLQGSTLNTMGHIKIVDALGKTHIIDLAETKAELELAASLRDDAKALHFLAKPFADKTRAEYLGQLKAILEFSHSNGFISSDISVHIEIPNTKQSKAIERLPFTTEDLQKIFPGEDYRVDFGIHKSGVDLDAKFWFPLMAAFSGARLEELGQLNTSDIHTCPDTGIIYAMIDNQGVAADGHKSTPRI